MRAIKLISSTIGEVVVELSEENLITARKLLEALPVEGKANLWGDEIYFRIPVEVEPENPRIIVKEGEVAIWIEEPSLCIFFGKTPVSTGDTIRAYSEVNVIGKVVGDCKVFKNVKPGELIRVERIE